MKDYKIVFVDRILPISDYEKKIIEGFGCTVTQYNAITPQEILEVAADADAIMTVGAQNWFQHSRRMIPLFSINAFKIPTSAVPCPEKSCRSRSW